MAAQTRSETVPAAMQERYAEIAALTDAFCAEHLNAEYAQTCRWLLAALARKRPSPLGGRQGHRVGSRRRAYHRPRQLSL
jgi:hypothetical protein